MHSGAQIEGRIPRGVVDTPVVGGLDVANSPPRIEEEGKDRLPVEERVEHDAERITVPGVRIPLQRRDDRAISWLVVKLGPDVQVLVVVQNADLGAFRGRCARKRLLLPELADDNSRAPGRVVQHSVNADGARGPCGRG